MVLLAECFRSVRGGKFRIAVNGVYKTGEIVLSGSAGVWNETLVYPIELETGEQYIDFRIKSGDIDIDWIKFGQDTVKCPVSFRRKILMTDNIALRMLHPATLSLTGATRG